MRRFLLFFLLIIPSIILMAQTNTSFTCADVSTYQSQFTIVPPDISDLVTEISVTALGRGNYQPVIGISTSDDFTDCYLESPEAEYYDLSLPSGDFQPALTNASGLVYEFGANEIHIGEVNGQTGALVVLLETLMFEEDHHYHLNLAEDIAGLDESLNVYLVSLEEQYEPSLTIVDVEGAETVAEPATVNLFSLYGDSFSSVTAPLPTIAGDVELIVESNGSGFYALIMELQSGAVQVGDGSASVSTGEDASISLTCDGIQIFNNGLRFILPDDTAYTATVLSDAIDPVLATVDSTDTGICYDNSPATLDYSLELPFITIARDTVYPQASTTSDASLVFGGYESSAGSYVLLLEGGELSEGDEGDVFDLVISPQMRSAESTIVAYVFTSDMSLDPVLTWETSAGEEISCNDAGVADFCDQDVEDFSQSLITLANNETLSGIDLNPMLEIPIEADSDDESIRLRVSANDDTSGGYILILQIETD